MGSGASTQGESGTLSSVFMKSQPDIQYYQVIDVMYLKFKQHPNLRHLLLNTGSAPIVYNDLHDTYWADGPDGNGANELGKALMHVREQLKEEGYGNTPWGD